MEKITVADLAKLSKDDLKGRIICFPTDTVYGVGALADDVEAIGKIYAMKHREAKKPLPILAASTSDVEKIVIVPNKIKPLIYKFWPGALTVILNKQRNCLPNYKETIAVRIPNDDIALQVISKFGILATTSVNISGNKELSSIEEIDEMFGDMIDYCITDKTTFTKLPSTIIDVTEGEVKIIRQGSVSI